MEFRKGGLGDLREPVRIITLARSSVRGEVIDARVAGNVVV